MYCSAKRLFIKVCDCVKNAEIVEYKSSKAFAGNLSVDRCASLIRKKIFLLDDACVRGERRYL
jgi:hypothetical protein